MLTVSQLTNLLKSVQKAAVPNWVRDVGERGIKLINNPKSAVLTIVFGFVINQMVRPFFGSIVQVALILVDSVQILFFGFDRTLGPTGPLGLADLPLAMVALITDALQPAVFGVIGEIVLFNQELGRIAASAGLAAFPIVTLAAVVEIGVAAFLLWTLISSVDIPYIDQTGILRATTYPFRLVLGALR